MPIHFNDALDDPLAFDRQRSCVGGQVSFARVNLLGEDQCAALVNVDTQSDLAVENRRGFRRWGDLAAATGSVTPQGLWFFDYGSTQFLLALAGGSLYRGAADGSWTLITAAATPSATARGHGDQIGNTFWLSTGDGRGRFWTAAQLAAGHAGTAVTDGPAALTLLTSLRFRLFGLNAATPDEVYCSRFLPDSATPFTISAAIAPFRIGEGRGSPIARLIPWKGLFSLVALKGDSIWMVDTTPAQSSTAAATITASFGIQQIGWMGTSAGQTVCRAANDILYLSDDGVRSLARTVEDGEGKVSEPLSLPVHDIIQRINAPYIATACATFHAGRYLLALPLDASTVPNHLLVWNSRNGAWVVWTGIQPVQMVVAEWTGGPRRLMVLDTRGHVLEYRDHVSTPIATDYRDNVTGSEVRPSWAVRSRGMTWGDIVSPKDPESVEFEFDRSQALVDIDVILDNDASGERLASKVRTGFPGWILAPDGGSAGDYPSSVLDCTLGESKLKRIRRSLTQYPNAREMMFEIREAGDLSASELDESGVFRMRGIVADAFLETKEADE